MGAQESTKQDFLPGKQKNKDIFPLAHIIVHFDHVLCEKIVSLDGPYTKYVC